MKHIITSYPERYFVGVEFEGGVTFDKISQISSLWKEFMESDIKLLDPAIIENKHIGLECYPPDFMERKVFDYYALVQTKKLIREDGFVSKKLPAGRYIQFETTFGSLRQGIEDAYKYLRDHNIAVNNGFDVEDYIPGQDYSSPESLLYLSFLLVEEDETTTSN